MTTRDIAKKLVAYNRSGNYEACYQELYAPEAVSIENWGPAPERYEGMEAIVAKATGWKESVLEIHEVSCSDPLIADSSFAVTFTMDITYKDRGRSGKMTELAIYTVRDGKIVEEEFQA